VFLGSIVCEAALSSCAREWVDSHFHCAGLGVNWKQSWGRILWGRGACERRGLGASSPLRDRVGLDGGFWVVEDGGLVRSTHCTVRLWNGWGTLICVPSFVLDEILKGSRRGGWRLAAGWSVFWGGVLLGELEAVEESFAFGGDDAAGVCEQVIGGLVDVFDAVIG